MIFDRMDGGWYMAAVPEQAVEFAQGDPDRLVAAAFARFLSERGVEFEWDAADATRMKVGGWWDILISGTTETGETITTTGDEKTYTLYGNTCLPGCVVLMGLTFRAGKIAVRHLLSIDEFVKGVTPHAFGTVAA